MSTKKKIDEEGSDNGEEKKSTPKESKSVESDAVEEAIDVDRLCDLKGVGQVERWALNKKYKGVTKTLTEWLEFLKGQISFK